MKIAVWIDDYSDCTPLIEQFSNNGNSLFLARTGFRTSTWSVWENGKQVTVNKSARPPNILRMMSLKFKMLMAMFRWGKPDVWVVEGSWGIIGLFLRRLGMIKWLVCAYFDHNPKDEFMVRLMSRLCHFAANRADEVWPISPRIPYGQKRERVQYYVGISEREIDRTKERTGILYMSHGCTTHGLPMLFDAAKKLGIPVHLVGDSDYLDSLKKNAPENIIFHGYVPDEEMMGIASRSFCGWAVYTNLSRDHYQWFGFPAKYFQYLSLGLPILTSDVAFICQTIRQEKLGVITDCSPADVEQCLVDLQKNWASYAANFDGFKAAWNKTANLIYAAAVNRWKSILAERHGSKVVSPS